MTKNIIASDFETYLATNDNKSLLRFLTCGSVDDGKSSLIGRLLHDAKLIYDDQLAALQRDSRKFNTTDQDIDLALLVDGLQAEREQGITIDVAYRYFSTDKRKFIIADTPGHEQYTRNMATGASHCDLAIILVDASSGVKAQTRRHSFICSLLGIRHIVVAINKMDLVSYSESVFKRICDDFLHFAAELEFIDIIFIPLSALRGENVVKSGNMMPWYHGPCLLPLLETVKISEYNEGSFRFPVQYVNRPDATFRGYCGTVARGSIRVGDPIKVWPSGKNSRIARIVSFDGDLEKASHGKAVTLTLEDEVDISRGDILAAIDESWYCVEKVSCMLVWLHETPLQLHRQYEIRVGTRTLTGFVDFIDYRVNIEDLSRHSAVHMQLNEIAHCQIRFTVPIPVDTYKTCRETGALIIIDRLTNATMGAGMIAHCFEDNRPSHHHYSDFEIELNELICKYFPHWGAKKLRELL